MSRLLCLIGAMGLYAGASYADGSQCVSLENDIARLACFDEAYQQAKEPDMSPTEAVEALADLVRIETHKERFSLAAGQDPCDIKAIYEGIITYNQRPKPYQIISYANLRTVERVGSWKGYRDWSGGVRGMVLYHDREGDGVWVASVHPQYLEGAATIEGFDFYTIPETKSYNGRDAIFYLLPFDYRTDAGKVEQALRSAVTACGGDS